MKSKTDFGSTSKLAVMLAACNAVAAATAQGQIQTFTPFSAGDRVFGLDVSAFQGDIAQATWNDFHNIENRQFAFIRSSRGGTTGYYNQSDPNNTGGQNTLSQRYDDPYFVQNITRATDAGLLVGSYHFSRPDIISTTLNSGGIANNGTDEADHFIQMAGAFMRPGYLPPVHDLEAGQTQRTRDQLTQFALDFSNRIYAVMGIRPAIYINGNYSDYLNGSSSVLRTQLPTSYPMLWNARWPSPTPTATQLQTASPKDTYANFYGAWNALGTQPWAFWQYTSTGRLQSFNSGNSDLDLDVAQGSIELAKDYLIPALWMSDTSDDWGTLSKWNSGQTPIEPVQGSGQVPRVGPLTLPTPRLPGEPDPAHPMVSGADDTITLNRPAANVTVTLSTGTYNARRLNLFETLNVTGGSLGLSKTGYVANGATLSITGGAFTVNQAQVDPGGVLEVAGPGTLNVSTLYLNPTTSVPGSISTYRQSAGTATLGTVYVGSPQAGASSLSCTGGTLNITTLDVANPGSVTLNGAQATLTTGSTLVRSSFVQQAGTHNAGPLTIRRDDNAPPGFAAATYESINLQAGAAGVLTLLTTGADDDSVGVNLATNTFRFHGVTYTGAASMFVSANGLISFGAADGSYNNTDLASSPVEPCIAPLWDDLILRTADARVLRKFEDLNNDSINDRLILEWHGVDHYSSSPSPITFQAILGLNSGSSDGSVTFNYVDVNTGDLNTDGSSATVGVRDGAWKGLVSFNNGANPFIGDNKAVQIASSGSARFTLSGGTLSTPSISVQPGGEFHYDGGTLSTTSVTVDGGVVEVGLGANRTLVTSALSVINGGKVDLSDNAAILRGMSLAGVKGLITSGFNGGAWNNPGINSSTAAADANHTTALGYASNAELGLSSWRGVTGLTSNDVLVKYTYYGDADLNGAVTLDDFTLFLIGYQNGKTTWFNGDYDYSGTVTLDDFTLFLKGYQQHGAPLSEVEALINSVPMSGAERAAMLAAVSAIPEPAILGGIGLLGFGLSRRRRGVFSGVPRASSRGCSCPDSVACVRRVRASGR
jgi:GH25 family lysozyme M1 (1,4-beta-N-acetylmuramidase)